MEAARLKPTWRDCGPSYTPVGRDHIALELRKLYEGAQFSVIKHYCGYAVKESSVPVPKSDAEKRNIGIRAREVIDGFLAYMKAIEEICDAAGLSFTVPGLQAASCVADVIRVPRS
jgi:hypothetical protein